MKTQYKKINVGKIQGLSSYQLAVATGQFNGTLEEYVAKEQSVYDDMVEYADDIKAFVENSIAGITNNNESIDLAEVISARGTYKTLKERLDVSDEAMDTILTRLNQIDPNSINVDAVVLNGNNKNIEMRNNGVEIQMRVIGESNWTTLVTLQELTPKFSIGSVTTATTDEDVSVTMSGTPLNRQLNFVLPRAKDGVEGGSIVDSRIDENGNLIIIVENDGDDEYTGLDENGKPYILPVFSVGTVESIPYNQNPYVTITGTSTNPILNFGIPKPKPLTVKRVYKDENGLFQFELE